MNTFLGHKYTAEKCLKEVCINKIDEVNKEIQGSIDTIMNGVFTKQKDNKK